MAENSNNDVEECRLSPKTERKGGPAQPLNGPVDLSAVHDGLKIKVQDVGQQVNYTYGHAGDSRPVDWKIIVSEEEHKHTEGEHICCLQLKEGVDLVQLVEQFQSAHAKAIVFVNTRDDLVVEAQQWPQDSTIPIFLLKASDGKELLITLDNNEVFGKVEVESHVDSVPVTTAAVTQEPIAASPVRPALPEKKDKEGYMDKIKTKLGVGGGDRRDFKAEVKQLMFNNDIPMVVSEDSGTFVMVMSTFQQYEKTGKGDGGHGDVLKRLVKYLNSSDVFENDFPFYIILAYRIKLNRSIYGCDDLAPFVNTCIDKMEALDLLKLCSTLSAFFQRGDFPVMFGKQDSTLDVFKLLETACLDLAVASLNRSKKSEEGRSPEHLVYKRMVWVSVALKCHSEAGAVTRSVDEIWNKYLLQMVQREQVFTPETIEDLRHGLSLTKLMNIPSAAMMSSQQMIELVCVDGTTVRPLSYLMNYLDCMAEFITSKADFAHLITTLRAHYHSWVLDNHSSKLTTLSIEGTVAGAIQEGLQFVDKLREILQKQDMNEELCSSEELGWLSALLDLVDVTKPGAAEHLMRFFSKGKSQVLKTHRTQLTKDVIERTKQSFPQLPIHLFYPLYKHMRIWPHEFVKDYLNVYKVPLGVKMCDGTWNVFIGEVISRHSGAHAHRFLLDFVKTVGDNYVKDGRSYNFILDLLGINVPKLFGLPEDTDKGHPVAVEVQSEFSAFIQNYIHLNTLKIGLFQKMDKILASISEQPNEFQQLILIVVQKEVIPELRTFQSDEGPAQHVLTTASTRLQKDLSWIQALNPQQKFCWGIVATCCSKISSNIVTDNFDWIHSYDNIISQLGQIYASYCIGKKLPESERVLADTLPQDIARLPSDDVHRYFEWVRRLQKVLFDWQRRIQDGDCSYDDILMYASNQAKLFQIGQLVCSRSAIIDSQVMKTSMNYYLELFEKINAHFIKYIQGNPDAKYCTLPQILHHYGVLFPPKFTLHLLLPGDNVSTSGEQMLVNPITPSTNGTFQPPSQSATLRATQGLTVKELVVLAEQLDQFVKPILDHMHMLVFFSLHQSEIFNNYLRLQLKKEFSVKKAAPSLHPSMIPSLTLSALQMLGKEREEGPKEEVVSIQILAKALNTTRAFLVKLIQGTAKYSEIIAEDGELKLENINIEAEFNTFTAFFAMVELVPQVNSHDGLKGILGMRELFQYTSVHIPTIHGVCEQYKLEGCLKDPSLKELVMLAEEVERNRANLIPLEAVEKMRLVKKSLCLKTLGPYHSLGLFAAVANSAAFVQFVRDKNFDSEKGQAVFGQQYQLITAQLEHEEYNENVLNHLYAAYKFILPFMDIKQNFSSLMSKVTSLDVSGGLKQLETVNSNITLICLWFSRAEGDTLQNVAKDLDSIIETGHYQFEFSSEGIGLSLQHCTAASPSSLDDELLQRPKALMLSDRDSYGKERWSKEQIDDFVRKLGFLDAEKEGGDTIKQFLHLNETVNNMLRLFMQLRDLGCAEFTKGAQHITLPCSIEDVDSWVKETEAQLLQWKGERLTLCDQNAWMLFFHTPKLLLLYKEVNGWTSLLQLCDSENVEDMAEKMQHINYFIESETKLLVLKQELLALSLPQACSSNDRKQFLEKVLLVCKELSGRAVRHIVKEISFLCENNPRTFDYMMNKVETTLEQHRHDLMTSQTPMHTISVFLSELLLNHSLPTRIKPIDKSLSASRISVFSQVLHSCPGFTHKALIPLILNIFGGVPEPFQIFRCQPSSTQEELALFLKRATKFPILHLIVEVNKLPFHLQEYLMQFHWAIEHDQSLQIHNRPRLQYIETRSTNLRDMPWITLKEHKVESVGLKVSLGKLAQSLVQLVYGNAGDGKTLYIRRQLSQSTSYCTIAVNEAFTPLAAIKKLRCLPSDQPDCAIFFNFTLLPPGRKCVIENPDHEDKITAEYALYCQLLEVIGWFFFDLLILGYVEDKDTGLSFRLPGKLEWLVYVEVPSRDLNMTPDKALQQFYGEIPILGLKGLGSPHLIFNQTPFIIDDEVQLVCKYLKAYKEGRINRLYKNDRLVKFSTDPKVADDECHKLLSEYMPEHIRTRKIMQRLFIKYMHNRCQFLDCFPDFNYNTGVGEYKRNSRGERVATVTRELGSSLMKTMLKEVGDFCDPAIKENWSLNPCQQLIYDIKDGGGSLDLITLHADKVLKADRDKFKTLGVNIPSMMEMHSRQLLDKYLSRAFNVELTGGRLKPIDDAGYVLTLDYTLKMLNIHERYRCGIPVIIEGETGVGKTALVQMLSVLWHHPILCCWNKEKSRIHELLTKRIGNLSEDSYKGYEKCVQLIHQLSEDKPVSYEDMLLLCNLPGSSQSPEVLYTLIRRRLLEMRHLPVVALLVTKEKADLHTLFQEAEASNTVEATAKLLQAVYFAQLQPTFFKLNVHAALSPLEIQELLRPAFDLARELQLQSYAKEMSEKIPFVTVFLDEVNTSSCLGLLKEVIVDKTLDGEPIPENVFIVAACLPHRENSLASHEQDMWLRESYYVHPLHPTLQLIKWDYGSLDSVQERDYINAKMKMLHRSMSNVEAASLTELIVESQEVMRHYAAKQLRAHHFSTEECKVASHSCVSQRDIQRVFILHEWLMKGYEKVKPYGDRTDYHRRALLVALGIVYYMRLNTKFREAYRDLMDKQSRLPNEVKFSKAFSDELEWYIDEVDLPQGIAKTQALKENIFATIICALTRIPLIIVGAPGSSKTLSFNITVQNLKGQESKTSLFRCTDRYPSLDPHYYQCSRRTTSNEIQTVFSRAINRQKSHVKNSLPINCVVFMDIAGLPEQGHESLKVLHYYLDNPEVSFVAITNHVLDAAKTNRAISLVRPESSGDDLEALAKGCLCSTPDNPPPELKNDLHTISGLCIPYLNLMMEDAKFKQFFGLRDFIHFVNYLRRRCQNTLSAQVVLQALERNFNGSDEFEAICKQFLSTLGVRLDNIVQRHILDILRDSLADRPNKANRTENEVRYKLIVDPSEDDSLVRLLFTFGVLDRQSTRVFVCSDFPGDTHLQKINTIAAIRHSAIEGHTVVMAQTDDIHESFYDLFNQRFRRIDDAHGPRYYANIAIGAHSNHYRVHPDFQCVVVVKQSEVKNTPALFLNCFEKYRLTHHALLEAALGMLSPCMAVVMNTVREKINGFVESVRNEESFYGLKKETTDSLLLSMLPTERHTYQPYEPKDDPKSGSSFGIEVICLQELVLAFRTCAGFHIPTCSLEELTLDAQHVSYFVCADPEFQGLLQTITPRGVAHAVAEAMQKLNQAPAPQGNDPSVGLSPEGCMMVAMAVQWLVRHLCKRLMQLMTPEALTIHRKNISSSYLVNYLRHHSHFSLKVLIKDRLNAMHHATTDCPTKLLCYTRTSSLIHKLPLSYCGEGLFVRGIELSHEAVKDLVLDDLAAVVVYKLSNKPQNSIMELLRTFAASQSAQVLLLIANMAEVTVPVVNHLRIMIEEAENQSQSSPHPKLFVLLLHFPPHNFLNPCYPTLYLRGWDHYYLDTIGHHHGNGAIDVEDWFSQCCFKNSDFEAEDDCLVQTARDLLEEVIAVISSRVPFSFHEGFPFNGQLSMSRCAELLHDLLIKKEVGVVLCKLFRSYWKPSVMVGYLEQAANLAHQQQSTLNITDTIQAAFKVTFMDFVVVMVSRMNENCNIDSVFVNGGSPAVDALFRDLLAVSPLPLLTQLKVLSNSLQAPCNPGYIPIFPFFHMVIGHMDQLIEQAWRDTNEGTDVLGNVAMAPNDQPHNMQATLVSLRKRMLCSLKERKESAPKGCVVVCVHAVVNNPELWSIYFNNFIFSKLHLAGSGTTIEKQIVQQVFGNLDTLEITERIVYLHTYMAVYQLDLAKVATILRSLSKLETISIPSPPPPSPAKQFMYSVHQHVSTYVVGALFKALLGCLYAGLPQAGALEQLKQWYKAYLEIMTLPSLVDNICADLSMQEGGADMELVRAQLNTMQTTFSVLQCKAVCDSEVLNVAQKIFCTLFTRHFKENGELKDMCPGLLDVCQVAVECLKASPSEDDCVKRLIERIFNHFFPIYCARCSSDDCRWFLSCANSQRQWFPREKGDELNQESLASGCCEDVSIHIFKLYLSRILGEQNGGNTASRDPLPLCNERTLSLVGEVLMSNADLGCPTHYIPVFYQQSTFIVLEPDVISARMQQPLAHLYFLVVMEHMFGKQRPLPALLHTYFTIKELCKSTTRSDQEKVLLYIELQAVVQVIVQQVAIDLDSSEPYKIRQLAGIKREVNAVLDDAATGGGACKGHTLVLALHLLKRLKSFRKFTDLLTVQFDAACRGISCLEQFSVDLKEQAEPKPHLFPFMVEDNRSPLGALYERVRTTMLKIHDGKGNIEDLIKIATERITSSKIGTQTNMDSRGAFRMAVWLTVYYDFFDKNKKSELLCNSIGNMSRFFEEGHIAIIQRFLNPDLMLTKPELPYPLREDEEVLVLQVGGRQAKPNQRKGKAEDPLLELFRPSKSQPADQSDVDLRHALANMLAMVMASPKASNHLWYHMFAPGDLLDTYMTGFMYDTKVSPNGLHYNCGVELSTDGQFGHQDYLKHACRGTYTLHSLYLLLWANFGAFCVALLTQPNAEKKLHGTIISDRLPIRHYCVSQLRTVWLYMRNNFNITEEERSFLLMRCMMRFYETAMNPATAANMVGRLSTREQLDSYERLWHTQIYQPSWSELKEEFSQYSLEWQTGPVFLHIRFLDEQYPQLPTEKDFTHNLLCSDISLQKQGGGLSLLTQFVLERPQLLAGGLLLPDLVEFYLWLHTQLAYIVSYDNATELKIGQVVERAVERYSTDYGKHVNGLYDRVKAGYNAYVEAIGHAFGAGAYVTVSCGNKVCTITDDIPLLHFLSDTPDEEKGNDWLYTVMADIVNTHNHFIEGLYTIARSQCLSVNHLLPSEPYKIPLTEFTKSHCIMGEKNCLHDVDNFLQLVRSRYSPRRTVCVPDGKAAKNQTTSISISAVQPTVCQFNLHLLQEDMVATYLAGKPLLESASSIRTHFKFRNKAQQSHPHPADVASSGGDIEILGDQLPDPLKVSCDDSTLKKMEFEFHSASYLTLLEAVQAMKNVLGHLINYIKKSNPVNTQQTVRQFMAALDSQIDQNTPVFAKASTPTLSPPQLKFLESLPTAMVFTCLQLFILWLKDGMHDFHTLPFTLKTHLSPEDQEALLQIPIKWRGDIKKLIDELKTLSDSLVHSEAYFTKNTNETLQTPLKIVLEDLHFLSQEDLLPPFIPRTICVQHYVAFRIVLRRLVATVTQLCDADIQRDVEVERWQEFVGDMWDKRLPHFRDCSGDGGLFVYDPTMGQYEFQIGLEEEERPLPDVLDDDAQEGGGDLENENITINDTNLCSSNDDYISPLNISLKDGLVCAIRKETALLEELAEKFSVDDVVDFLHSIRMDQYIDAFRDREIDGSVLVAAGDKELNELGVSSPLHCFKIQFLFKHFLQNIPTTHALDVVFDFLAASRMDQYGQRFAEEGVDGDMLLEILQLNPDVGDAILKELGIESNFDKLRMRKLFKPPEGSVPSTMLSVYKDIEDHSKTNRDQAKEEHGLLKIKQDQMRDLMKRELDQAKCELIQMRIERDQAKIVCDVTKREHDQTKKELFQIVKEQVQVKKELDQAKMEHNDTKKERDQIKMERDQAKIECSRELDHVRRELNKAKRDLLQMTNKHDQACMERDKTKVEHDMTRKERDQMKIEQREMKAKQDQMIRELDQAKMEHDMAMRERDQMKIEQDQAKRELDQTKRELTQAKRELTQMMKERDQASVEQDKMKVEHDMTKKERDQMKIEQREMKTKQDQMKRELDQTKIEHDMTKRERDQMKIEQDQMKRELDQAKSERDQAIKERDQARDFWRVPRHQVALSENVLGKGAWGYVKVGQFRGQQVAIKCIHENIIAPRTIRRVEREICTMSQVRHPNLVLFIAAVLDDQGGPMIITELLDTTLREVYKDSLLNTGQCMDIFRDIASALCYLHELGEPIVHRDVNSANVLMQELARGKWKAKLSDFGSANWVKDAQTLGEGAIVYTAPEAFPLPVAQRHKAPAQTTKIDVYSYGIVLCEVILREFPDPDHLDETKEKMKTKHATLHSLVERCTQDDPAHRPSMADVLKELVR